MSNSMTQRYMDADKVQTESEIDRMLREDRMLYEQEQGTDAPATPETPAPAQQQKLPSTQASDDMSAGITGRIPDAQEPGLEGPGTLLGKTFQGAIEIPGDVLSGMRRGTYDFVNSRNLVDDAAAQLYMGMTDSNADAFVDLIGDEKVGEVLALPEEEQDAALLDAVTNEFQLLPDTESTGIVSDISALMTRGTLELMGRGKGKTKLGSRKANMDKSVAERIQKAADDMAELRSAQTGMMGDVKQMDASEPLLTDVAIELFGGEPITDPERRQQIRAMEGGLLGEVLAKSIRGIAHVVGRKRLQGVADEVADTNAAKYGEELDTTIEGSLGGKGPIYSVDKTGTSNINYNRLETTDDVIDLIDTAAKKNPRDTIPDAEIIKAAEDMGMTADDILAGGKEGIWKSPAHVLEARNVMVKAGEELSDTAKDFEKRGLANVTDSEKMAFLTKLGKFRGIVATVQGATADAGRMLRQFRLPAGNKARMEAIQQALGETDGGLEGAIKAMSQADGEQTLQLIKTLNRVDANSKIKGFNTGMDLGSQFKASLGMLEEATYRVWATGLLSAAYTLAVNNFGVPAYYSYKIASKYASTRFSARFPSGGTDTLSMGEMHAQFQSMRASLPMLWRTFSSIYKTGVPDGGVKFISPRSITSPFKGMTPADYGLEGSLAKSAFYLSKGIDSVASGAGKRFETTGATVPGLEHIGSRLMMASDGVFKHVIGESESAAMIFRQVTQEGLEDGTDDFAQRYAYLMQNKPPWVVDEARRLAEEYTFTDKPIWGKKAVETATSLPVFRFFGIFANTATRLFNAGAIKSTPMYKLTREYRDAINQGGALGEEAAGRFALATVVGATVFDAALNGYVTGAGPSDPTMRKMMERADLWHPNSIDVGKLAGGPDAESFWIGYNRMDPLAWPLSIYGTLAEAQSWDDGTLMNRHAGETMELHLTMANMLKDRTYVRGISNLFEVFAGSEQQQQGRLDYLAQSMTATLTTPSQVFSWRKTFDDYKRWAPGYVDKIQNRIPGVSSDLPIRRGTFGEPLPAQAMLGPDFISFIPYGSKKTNQKFLQAAKDEGLYAADPKNFAKLPDLYAEMYNVGAVIRTLPKTLSSGMIDISTPDRSHMYARYEELVGTVKIDGLTLLERAIITLEDPNYTTLKYDEPKADYWKNVVYAPYKSAAQDILMQIDFPELLMEKTEIEAANEIIMKARTGVEQ